MFLRQIVIIIITALVCIFGYRSFSTYCANYCAECSTEAGSIAAAASAGPLLFNWESEEVNSGASWDELKSSMLAGMAPGKVLEITGEYFEEETNDTSHSNLGVARATEVGELLKKDEPELKYIAKGKLVDEREGVRTAGFESLAYNWVAARDEKEMTIEITDADDAKILFPFNSTDRIESSAVTNYLNSVAERLNGDSSLKAYIVGYTDNYGEPGANRRLSERRAKKIRDYLKSKGVAHKQIVPSGRGEADAIASNGTDEGRQENRRVEITIR